GPLVGGGALHLQQGQPAQGGVAEQPEQAAALVGHLGGEGGRRLFADDLLQVRGRVAALIGGAALAPALVAAQPAGLAGRQRNEQSPQVVAVVQPGEPALLAAGGEAGEGAEGRVPLVGGPPRRVLESRARQPDEAVEVTLPKVLGGGLVAGLELSQPLRDRPLGRHGFFSWGEG